ncbi:unnamed protein product [marine sediment metagenome]|uniref:Uncharacterized protein n=1 Tax=marine sediment metagenome TaxID=412755 RepID=X1G8C3_9ZZZZ
MSQVWSEINKVVNVSEPAAHAGTTTSYYTDIVNMENYKKCTFILASGSTGAANSPVITVVTGASSTAATTAIAFKYRTQIASTGACSLTGGDVPSVLTTTTGTAGFAISSGKAGGVYIIEVDAADVAAGTTTSAATDYDHVALKISTGATEAAHIYGIIAVLSEPRYPQAILDTAIGD